MKKLKKFSSILFVMLLILQCIMNPIAVSANELVSSLLTEAVDSSVENTIASTQTPTVFSTTGPAVTVTGSALTFTKVELYDTEPAFVNDTLVRSGKNLATDIVRPNTNSLVAAIFDWVIPANHEYVNGSTFTFTLSDKILIQSAISGNLDGGIGTYQVSPNGTVTFTFNKDIENSGEITGYFYVWAKFNQAKLNGALEQKIDFSSIGQADITVHFNNPNPSGGMTKKGVTNKTMNPDQIDWVVDFNLNEETLTNVKFMDELPTGLTLIPGTVKVTELVVNLSGDPTLGAVDATKTSTPLATPANAFEIDFGTSTSKAYRVEYSTKVDPILTDPYSGTFKNKASVTSNGSPKYSKDFTASVQFSKPLSKSSPSYDASTQTITWKIEYNYNQQSISQTNAFFTDTFDTTHQELIDASFVVTKKSIANNGSASTIGTLTKGTDYTVTTDGTGFVLQFANPITDAYEIVYQTKAINRVYDASKVITNTVDYNGITATSTRTISQVIFNKSNTGIDYGNKTINWKIDLNDDLRKMENVVIKDNFAGQN